MLGTYPKMDSRIGQRTGSSRISIAAFGIAVLALAAGSALAAGECAQALHLPQGAHALTSPGKITPDLMEVAGALRSLQPQQRANLSRLRDNHIALPVFKVSGSDASMLQVYMYLKDTAPATLNRIRMAGAQIELVNPDAPLVQARIPLDQLEQIAELPAVVKLARPNYSLCNVGLITTEGDAAMGADEVRSGMAGLDCASSIAGPALDGAGVSIGVLSVGLFDYEYSPAGRNSDARVQTLDLPAAPSTPPPSANRLGAIRLFPITTNLSYFFMPDLFMYDRLCPANGLSVPTDPRMVGNAGSRLAVPTGALMLEVIHDVAPSAPLLFGDASTDLQFHISREYLAENGVRVMVDDVAFPGLGRYDGTSAVSVRASQLVQYNNIVYLSAVGDFTPSEAVGTSEAGHGKPLYIQTRFNGEAFGAIDNFHSFSAPGANRDETLEVSPDPELGFFEAFLVWDDVWVNNIYTYQPGQGRGSRIEQQGRATDDIDMYLISRETHDLSRPVAFSTRLQNGASDNPVEHILVSNASIPISLVIRRKDTNNYNKTMMTLVITAGQVDEPQYLTHGVPLCNSDAADVISVGAVDVTRNFGGLSRIQADTIPGLNPGPGALVDSATQKKQFLHWTKPGGAASPAAQKPELLSFDNVRTVTSQYSSTMITSGNPRVRPDNYRVRGSSIAAAHVAGLCALLRQKYYNESATSLRAAMLSAGNVVPIMTSELSAYASAPQYRLINTSELYCSLSAKSGKAAPLETPGIVTFSFDSSSEGWQALPLPQYNPYNPCDMYAEPGRLVIKSNQIKSFGYWESPPLVLLDADSGEQRTALDPNKLYRLSMTVGTDETDPLKVPDFRLRLMTTTSDEAACLVISGRTAMAQHAPCTPEGREYSLYYKPTAEVAPYGVTAAIDVFPFWEGDNSSAAIYLNSVTFEQVNP